MPKTQPQIIQTTTTRATALACLRAVVALSRRDRYAPTTRKNVAEVKR
jgi:hypothetical protein